MSLVEEFKMVQAFEPKTTNAAITSIYISLKNAITASVIVNLTQAVGHATQISLFQANLYLVYECVIDPIFKAAELQEAYGCTGYAVLMKYLIVENLTV